MDFEQKIQRVEQGLHLIPNIEMRVVVKGLIWEFGKERREEILWCFNTYRDNIFKNKYFHKRMNWVCSRYQYFNPQYHEVRHQVFPVKSEKTDEAIFKSNITKCKRMITKITNTINRYEDQQSRLLIPDFENEEYLKLKNKLKFYQEELNENKKQLKLFS